MRRRGSSRTATSRRLRRRNRTDPNVQSRRADNGCVLPFVLGAIVMIFRRDRNLLFLLGVVASGATVFGHVFYFGYMRHWGISFVALVAALWMQRSWRPRRSLLVFGFLAVGALTGAAVSARAWLLP